MGDAIGQMLPFAIGVTLSPIPIIAVVVMLGTPRAHVNGPAFLVGWFAGLLVLGTVVLLVASGAGASDDGGPATWTGWLRLALGAVLVHLAVSKWRGRPRGDAEPEMPGWMSKADGFSAPKAAGMGVLLSAANPKNLVLTVGAAAAIAQTGIDTLDQELALVAFVILGTIGPAVPVGVYFGMGDRAEPILEDLKHWLAAHNAAIMTVLMLVIGAKLIGDAISVLL
ncbi:MAG: GAP family protein [Solirubrobacteraceae bacterium]|nr:GAP family protein [Solirubrobacteraceae bacterium]